MSYSTPSFLAVYSNWEAKIFNNTSSIVASILQWVVLRVCLNRTYFVKIENWKYFSKIIFKCMNSVVRPIFNEKVAKKCNLWDPRTMHGCTIHSWLVNNCRMNKKKKTKRRTQNANAKLIWIQTGTKYKKSIV